MSLYMKEPSPEDPNLEPPTELKPILEILNSALLYPFGGRWRSDDPKLFLTRLQRARSWRLNLEPAHPVRDLIFRTFPTDPNEIWIGPNNLLLAEERKKREENAPTSPIPLTDGTNCSDSPDLNGGLVSDETED